MLLLQSLISGMLTVTCRLKNLEPQVERLVSELGQELKCLINQCQ